jgi:hypothetical protein
VAKLIDVFVEFDNFGFSGGTGAQQRGDAVYLLARDLRMFLVSRKETLVSPKHRRKNALPTIVAEQGEGVVLLANGDPHDPCPVPGCGGTLRFLHR